MRAPIELSLYISTFDYPAVGPEAVVEKLVDIATTAEDAGFTAVTLMDRYGETEDAVTAKLAALRAGGASEQRITDAWAGTPKQIAERAQELRAAGIEGLTFSIADVDDLDSLRLAGRMLGPIFGTGA
jgi:alkanesulfonate monooxygenase SsuD/methylene tetrahydromethanopterin reductase-like flavin-dependent oxidoreductase (luciferase family)